MSKKRPTLEQISRLKELQQYSINLIPKEYLGKVLLIWSYFRQNGAFLEMQTHFTPYELYSALQLHNDKLQQIDLVSTLGQSIMYKTWELLVQQSKKQLFNSRSQQKKKNGRIQRDIHAFPFLTLFNQQTENDSSELEQLLYYTWQRVYQEMCSSNRVIQMHSLKEKDDESEDSSNSDFENNEQEEYKDDGEQQSSDTETIDTENSNMFYQSFYDKDIEEKLDFFIEMIWRTASMIPKDNRITESLKNQMKTQKKQMNVLRALKTAGEATSKQIKEIIDLEEEYYFGNKYSLCLGRKQQNSIQFYIYKELPNKIFAFDEKLNLNQIHEGKSQINQLKNSLNVKDIEESYLFSQIDCILNSHFIRNTDDIEPVDQQEETQLVESLEFRLLNEDFQKLYSPIVNSFVQDKRKVPLNIELIKDLLLSTEEIAQSYSQDYYQSRWAQRDIRNKTRQDISSCTCVKILAYYLQDLAKNLETVNVIWINEKPNYIYFEAEMDFHILEDRESELNISDNKTVWYWSRSQMDQKQAFYDAFEEVEKSGDLQILFFLTYYYFSLISEYVEIKRSKLVKQRKTAWKNKLKQESLQREKSLNSSNNDQNQQLKLVNQSKLKHQEYNKNNRIVKLKDNYMQVEQVDSNSDQDNTEYESESLEDDDFINMDDYLYQKNKKRNVQTRFTRQKETINLEQKVRGGKCYQCKKQNNSIVELCDHCQNYFHNQCAGLGKTQSEVFLCKQCSTKIEQTRNTRSKSKWLTWKNQNNRQKDPNISDTDSKSFNNDYEDEDEEIEF